MWLRGYGHCHGSRNYRSSCKTEGSLRQYIRFFLLCVLSQWLPVVFEIAYVPSAIGPAAHAVPARSQKLIDKGVIAESDLQLAELQASRGTRSSGRSNDRRGVVGLLLGVATVILTAGHGLAAATAAGTGGEMQNEGASAAKPGEPARSVDVYFGQGSFWHLQHELALLEGSSMGRTGASITARAGYAGGKPPKNGPLCYQNLENPQRDHAVLGHAEVVAVSAVPADKLREVAQVFFDAVSSPPPEVPGDQPEPEQGPEYRPMLGLPGGKDSPFLKEIQAANNCRMQLAQGQGSDPLIAGNKVVWIYDSDIFPFFQAELYHQFHDDVGARYPADYHKLKEALVRAGPLEPLDCPDPVQ
ncbi:unnamed protein product, partial [Polarella glacialis]